ncbi:diphosphate--fructose-6-phosphate 1-phosphotransferase [Thalassobacillus pellis]|uniref:diphosphate--fructose-6-phosphate 1-phosphotransferase n=1 Tax=Thalassobacillus pellis TaxID=748008 RepID=UPI0019616036|nr:diphosphate--fructose-6-phosphate 1-phosphotransferase [Thalassobacillus pellis]MBM7554455.1 6-phosphofructokinase 1 [Thalassobacillus pellis]
MKKVAIGQAGGPTAVVNSTLIGFVDSVKDSCSITFVENGYEGLVNGSFINGDTEMLDWVQGNKQVPGACLGSGRFPFTDTDIKKAITNLRQNGIHTLAFIGGNGTMEALNKLRLEARKLGVDLQVIGIPKTVDNDIGCIDHAPGFGSAARYIAQTTKDTSRDLDAMKNFEQIRIIETMGRNGGWLAAASGLFKEYSEEGPHFIAIPEKPLDKKELLHAVRKAIQSFGYAVVVVSEGVQWVKGSQVEIDQVYGRPILGGISKEIEGFLKKKLNLMTRSELLGINQRSYSVGASCVDQEEAYVVGVKAGEWIKEGLSGCMVSIQRGTSFSYSIDIKPVELEKVIRAGERPMPLEFIQNFDAYYEWLLPLVGNGAPSYPPLLQSRFANVKR